MDDPRCAPDGQSSATARTPWAIVLAGGPGRALRDLTERQHGAPRPPQFAAFREDGRTMLEHTIERVRDVSPRDRILTTVGPAQAHFVPPRMARGAGGRILEQPRDRGTGVATLVATALAFDREPDGDVIVVPANLYVRQPRRMLAVVAGALAALRDHPERLVLLAGRARSEETDRRWVVPDRRAAVSGVRHITRLLPCAPKPDAARLRRRGALWSTGLVVARLAALWGIGWWCAPEWMARLEQLRRFLADVRTGNANAAHIGLFLRDVYDRAPDLDLYSDLLAGSRARIDVMRLPDDVEWEQWNRPERVLASLARRTAATKRATEPARFGGDAPLRWSVAW